MKKGIFILTLCLISITSFSQNHNRVKEANQVVWFGIDFSQMHLRGVENSFNNIPAIRDEFFEQWNLLVLQEKAKYDIAGAFRKETVYTQIATVLERNKQKDMNNLLSLDDYSLPVDSIYRIVKNYDANYPANIGLLFIVESLDKVDMKVAIWVTFFDIHTKEILFARRVTGMPKGIGFRNFWAGGIYKVIIECKDNYKSWMKGKY